MGAETVHPPVQHGPSVVLMSGCKERSRAPQLLMLIAHDQQHVSKGATTPRRTLVSASARRTPSCFAQRCWCTKGEASATEYGQASRVASKMFQKGVRGQLQARPPVSCTQNAPQSSPFL